MGAVILSTGTKIYDVKNSLLTYIFLFLLQNHCVLEILLFHSILHEVRDQMMLPNLGSNEKNQ